MEYRELMTLGLGEKESKTYLAALELGQTTAQKIAEQSKVNRASVYVAIEALMQKGLMSSVNEGKKQYFIAESPEKLSLLFREQAMEIQRKHEYLDKILPKLKSINNNEADKPVVRYFKGKESLAGMAEDIFYSAQNNEKMRIIYSFDLLKKMFSEDEIVSFRKKRQDRKVSGIAIVNDDLNRLKTDSEIYRLNSKEYNITSDFAIYGDKVRITTQKGEVHSLIIENKEISNTLKILYDLAIKYLKSK